MKEKYIFLGLLMISLIICNGCNKKSNDNINDSNKETVIDENKTVVDDQVFEGLEFLNVGVDNNIVKTIVINNTGVKYEGSKFSIKIMDASGNILKEVIDEIKNSMETGSTLEIKTAVDIDLTNAASIEYSILK